MCVTQKAHFRALNFTQKGTAQNERKEPVLNCQDMNGQGKSKVFVTLSTYLATNWDFD
jgi:hypothetical protein